MTHHHSPYMKNKTQNHWSDYWWLQSYNELTLHPGSIIKSRAERSSSFQACDWSVSINPSLSLVKINQINSDQQSDVSCLGVTEQFPDKRRWLRRNQAIRSQYYKILTNEKPEFCRSRSCPHPRIRPCKKFPENKKV